MKNCILVFVFLSFLLSAHSQTPFSFYPSFNPIEAGLGFGSKVDLENNEVLVSNQSTLVYLFEKNSSGIQQKQVIYSPNTSDGGFGYSISINNNFIAIGDPLINSVAENAGSVLMYNKTGDTYDLQQIITTPEALPNYHFGSFVKIFGNRLFISADNKVNNQNAFANNGAVYCYLYDGLTWVFQQKLEFEAQKEFGKKIDVNENILVVYTQFDTNTNHQYSLYKLDNSNNYSLTSAITTGSTIANYDFCLDGNTLYTLSEFVVSKHVINENGSNQPAETLINLGFLEQIPGSLAVSNDNLFIGSTSYVLAVTRKFPLLHYKKTGQTWTYHNTYYGIQPSGDDDYFGSVLAIEDNALIIGAPLERITLPYSGNVYYLDYLLANTKFEFDAISLFPNPTADRIFIKNNNSLEISKIELFSVSGKLLQTKIDNCSEISLENFAQGLYFAKIYSQNEDYQTFKIIKN
jgi:hypothetical protein